VAVVGGGNSAVTAAIHLSDFAKEVYLIHRHDSFEKADAVWLTSLETKKNVKTIFNSQVKGLTGETLLRELKYATLGEEREKTLSVDGIFIEVGLMPAAGLANQIGVTIDPQGYIVTNGGLETNVAGVCAAGDLVKQSDVPNLRQMITSAGQGAIAAHSVYSYLHKKSPAPNWG
jgi:thioredoxin reductase (NADPH)